MKRAVVAMISSLGSVLVACADESRCVAPLAGQAVEVEWLWTAGEVVSLPLVADVDGDGAPDVVVNASRVDGMDEESGELVLLDGATGAEKWRLAHDVGQGRFGSQGRSTVAVADVDGDGRPDIVYAGREDDQERSPIHAVDGAGTHLWTSHSSDLAEARLRVEHGAATVVNLDDDPNAEIVFGAAILDHDGRLMWNQDGQGAVFGSPGAVDPQSGLEMPLYYGGISTRADLDGDGKPELVTGREAWTITWTSGDPPAVSLSLLWRSTSGRGSDGWPAVADLDGNGTPEVVLVAWPDIKVLDGATGELWCGVDPTGAACEADPSLRTRPIATMDGNIGGPPTIADFDGDGRLEVGVASGTAYAVHDLARDGEVIVTPAGAPQPVPGAMFVRWTSPTQDLSSAATGAAAFDFDGDGAAEVVYQDECAVRVLDGASGRVWFERPNSSSTVHEYPVVADVDGDGATEFLVVASLVEPPAHQACIAAVPSFSPRKGVFAYGPGDHPWMPAPPRWTQHTQHVTDVDERGNVPFREQSPWAAGGTSSFRQAVSPAGPPACG